MIIFNLKTYPLSSGFSVYDDLNVLSMLIKENPIFSQLLYVAPNLTDILSAMEKYPNLNIVAQHIDAVEAGKSTGRISPETLTNMGVHWALSNHSERRIEKDLIIETLQIADRFSLKLIVCVEGIDEAKDIIISSSIRPFAFAYEPKELIGSGMSVSNYKKEEVSEFCEFLSQENIFSIIGAGVTTPEDILFGRQLGAKGFLIASAFAKSEDRKTLVKGYVNAYNSVD